VSPACARWLRPAAILFVSGVPTLAFLGPLEGRDAEADAFPVVLGTVVFASLVAAWGLASQQRGYVRLAALLMGMSLAASGVWEMAGAAGMTLAAAYLVPRERAIRRAEGRHG